VTNPPDDARIWHTLDALAYALNVILYDDDAALVIEHEGGLWATSYAEFDDLTALGWVKLTEDGDQPATPSPTAGTTGSGAGPIDKTGPNESDK